MLQSSLTFQGEHTAWKQRVSKEIGNADKYYKTWGLNSRAFGTTGLSSNSMAATAVKAYEKSNIDTNYLKKGNYYMIDSSYVVASDPNTMRDLGPWRNSEYYAPADPDPMGLSNTGYDSLLSASEWGNPQEDRK